MLDSRVTGELLAEARSAGAKVILAGDDRQLASIERGGLFAELRKAHGAAEITEVTRQKVDWQRKAARDLAEGRFDAAVQAFDRNRAVTWTSDQETARSALVERWNSDTAADPGASRFVFAYTNVEVDRLNAELRQVRRGPGRAGQPGRAARHKAWRGRVRGRRPGAVHRYRQEARHLQRECRGHHRPRCQHRSGHGAAGRRGREGRPGGDLVRRGVPGLPARLRGDDLQGPGQDARPIPTCCTPITGGRRPATWR